MEIEAKYLLDDAATIHELRKLKQLEEFEFSQAVLQDVQDVYLDTPAGLLQKHGYACRQRWSGKGQFITIKSLNDSCGTVHRRQEWEFPVSDGASPSSWPQNSGKELILDLVGRQPLAPQFQIHQLREVRLVTRASLTVLEWSLDEVRLQTGARRQVDLVLEVEVKDSGTEADLERFCTLLEIRWPLHGDQRSKFERARQWYLSEG